MRYYMLKKWNLLAKIVNNINVCSMQANFLNIVNPFVLLSNIIILMQRAFIGRKFA